MFHTVVSHSLAWLGHGFHRSPLDVITIIITAFELDDMLEADKTMSFYSQAVTHLMTPHLLSRDQFHLAKFLLLHFQNYFLIHNLYRLV